MGSQFSVLHEIRIQKITKKLLKQNLCECEKFEIQSLKAVRWVWYQQAMDTKFDNVD